MNIVKAGPNVRFNDLILLFTVGCTGQIGAQHQKSSVAAWMEHIAKQLFRMT